VFQLRLNLAPPPVLARVWTLNQRLPALQAGRITQLTSFHFVSWDALRAAASESTKSLVKFKRKKQKEGHGRWPYPSFWLPLLDLNQRPVVTLALSALTSSLPVAVLLPLLFPRCIAHRARSETSPCGFAPQTELTAGSWF
jgi:hypothetical protein